MFVEPDDADIPRPPARSAPRGFASRWEVLQDSFRLESIETDRFNIRSRRIAAEYDEIWGAVREALGEEGAFEALNSAGMATNRRFAGGRPVNGGLFQSRGQYAQALLDVAATLDSSRYGAFPSDPDALEDEVNTSLRAEWDDANDTLAMGPWGSGVVEFLGRGAAAMTDQTSLALMPLGGAGGSIGRIVLAEAALGAVGEAAVLPRMFEVSEEIGIPEPQPVQQIAAGAVFGGLLGGGGAALMRGISYARLRRQINPPAGVSHGLAQTAIAEAEQALASGRAVDPIPIPEPQGRDTQVEAELDLALTAAREAEQSAREEFGLLTRPALSSLRRSGIQLHPEGEAAAELRAMGVTSRTAPGLYSRQNGVRDIDNIVASESALREVVRTGDDGLYLDRQDLLDAISEEVGGRPRVPQRIRDAQAAQVQAMRFEQMVEGVVRRADARTAPETPDAGYFPTRNEEGFAESFDPIARSDRAMSEAERYSSDVMPMTEAERFEFAKILDDRGGYLDDVAERIALMDLEEAEYGGASRAFDRDAGGAQTRDRDIQGFNRSTEPTGRRGSGDQEDRSARTEQTPEGEQLLIDGVDAVSQRDRLEARQNAPLIGGNRAADNGLFDTGARLQDDMFEDLTSREATDAMDRIETDLRQDLEDIDAGEFDGMSAKQILRDLEADRDHMAAIDACGAGGTT